MPKQDFFAPVRRQAQRAFAALSKEIDKRQAELQELVRHADFLRSTISAGGGQARRGPGRPAGASGGKRLDWDVVLGGLPKTFTVDEVMKRPGVAAKGRNQVYPALSRWLEAKKVKRVGQGTYEKL